MMDFIFGAFIGLCVYFMIDGYKAHKGYRSGEARKTNSALS